jgi:ribosomal protein L4
MVVKTKDDVALLEGAELDETIRKAIVSVAKDNKEGFILLSAHRCKYKKVPKINMEKEAK